MLQQTRDIVRIAEQIASERGLKPSLQQLRRLSIADFGRVLLEMPAQDFPALSAILPKMASVDIQQSWTGGSGQPLLDDSVTFARILWYRFEEICGRSLKNARILDFGCGYGRLLRLMLYITDPDRIYGVDPYDRSVAICREDGVLGTIAQSDYLPTDLPVGDLSFDMIYSYSVFTHLSHQATRAALEVLRRYIASNGLLALTIRPVEFWNSPDLDPVLVARLRSDHMNDGFAFVPHNREPVEGDVTYGDTSIDPKWIIDRYPEWSFRGYDRGLDYSQQVLFFSPA